MGKRKEKRRISLYRRKGNRSLPVSFLRPPDASLSLIPATGLYLSLAISTGDGGPSLSLYRRRRPLSLSTCNAAGNQRTATGARPPPPRPRLRRPWRIQWIRHLWPRIRWRGGRICAGATRPPHLPPPAWPRGGHDEVEGGVLGLHSPPPVQQLRPPPPVRERAPRCLGQPGHEKANDRRGERRVGEARR
jgi:hypothetical protein